ncbi:AsmA family protein [Aquicella lusitana]|uniref:AsmA-like protein n=1 Tax=Aquicella lusitana TaxID=254246 RepID=A0A370GYD3_9COXI|nr:AsmA-like C-terminal region-containing protein [Aquicella lusitana]RDI48658.1 AsmA-like protein [Aquicella lusitana]VVC73965.1 hypothetical protein AQULUS_17260 [Aquicella lusitana]
MKLLRKLLAILILFIVICAFIIVSLVLFIDPNKLKPVIIEEVKKKTDYQLTMDGNLSWSFFPRLGVKVDHMTLTAPKQSTPFADLKNVTIATKFWELLQGNKELKGDVRIAEVRLNNLKAEHARIGLHWQNNVLTLKPLTASFYGGSLDGIAHGRTLSAVPQWDWDITMNRMQLSPLLADLHGTERKIKLSGTAQVRLQAETQGNSRDQLLANLNGSSQFTLTNGAIEGIDLNYFVQSADALLNQQPLPEPNNHNQTTFDSMTGLAVIKNGVATTNNLLLASSAFAVRADGSIDLVHQTLDYRLLVTPLGTVKLKWPVPVLVDGSLEEPSVRLDKLTLKTIITKEQVEKVKAKMQEEIKHLPEKANKFLQKLLSK